MSRGFFIFVFFYNMYKYILIQCALGFFFTLPKVYRSSSTKETYELLLPSHMPIFADISPNPDVLFQNSGFVTNKFEYGQSSVAFYANIM